jgi:cellulose synthase/poly-beta-1,6-N-acetylglucosamine synthase-like glycosyltransferase
VTPVRNSGKYLEATIRPVLAQDYRNLDYFIVDDGSADGTAEIIRKYESEISGRISEPDNTPKARWSEEQILFKIQKWSEAVPGGTNPLPTGISWRSIWMRSRSQNSSIVARARTVLLTNRIDWTAE